MKLPKFKILPISVKDISMGDLVIFNNFDHLTYALVVKKNQDLIKYYSSESKKIQMWNFHYKHTFGIDKFEQTVFFGHLIKAI